MYGNMLLTRRRQSLCRAGKFPDAGRRTFRPAGNLPDAVGGLSDMSGSSLTGVAFCRLYCARHYFVLKCHFETNLFGNFNTRLYFCTAMKQTNSKQYLWIAGVCVLALMIVGTAYYIFYQNKRMKEYLLQSELIKEELADEYNDLSNQYEGFRMTVGNDSLVIKLESEQLKVQRLQDELRTVKSTNAKRINELMKELKTLRTIMQGYIRQIDSLNRLNEQLTAENRTVTAKYNQATQTVSQLSLEKEKLTETIQMASQLDASNISVICLNRKNKTTDKIGKTDKIEIRFMINKNITATPGEKIIYIRIQKPDDDVLVKSRANVFIYENKEINYSAKRNIEYTGEEYPMSIYWQVEEYLMPGTYRVDIFADGNRIGQKSFRLEK
jgi:hypothetical protein